MLIVLCCDVLCFCKGRLRRSPSGGRQDAIWAPLGKCAHVPSGAHVRPTLEKRPDTVDVSVEARALKRGVPALQEGED